MIINQGRFHGFARETGGVVTDRPASAHTSDLPRLFYVGDVAVEATTGGSALLHRLLGEYPPNRLAVAVGDMCPVGIGPSLPGVKQIRFHVGWARLSRTRFHRVYSGWLDLTAAGRSRRLIDEARAFGAQAILTVTHASSFITAADLARRLSLPLHLILHDDWFSLRNLPSTLNRWAERTFGSIYRQASTRQCVCRYMAEAYEKRFGVPGTELYPTCAPDAPRFDCPPMRLKDPAAPIVVGYAGSLILDAYSHAIARVAETLERVGGRVVVYSNLNLEAARNVGLDRPNVQLRPIVPSNVLIKALREECTALFTPMTFDASMRVHMEMSFPSKMTDYSLVGVPMLIWGPPYCSAVRWAKENAPLAEVVDDPDPSSLVAGVLKLGDPEFRFKLAQATMAAGRKFFDHSAARDRFFDALRSCR